MKIINRGAESAKSDTQELYAALQAERTGLLTHVRDLQLATRLLLQAEAQRLAQKNHADPRLATLALQQNTLRDRIAVLDTELEVAAIRTPTVTKTDTLIHGRIADDNNRAAGAVTVMLLHADGRPLEGVKPVAVDDSGYYAFVLDPAVSANLQGGEKLTLALRRDDNTVAPGAGGAITFAKGAVLVHDVALTDAELRRLQLRVDLSSVGPVTGGIKPRQAAGTRSSSAKPKAGPARKKKS